MNVSIIVAFYNSEAFIARCIDSLLSQDYPPENYEIIMIDNNSRDGSAEIVKKFPRVKLLSEGKQGAYAARNRGLREAKGSILAFTDSDCLVSRDWLKKIDSAMASPDVGIVIGSCRLARDSFFFSLLEDYENEKNKYIFNNDVEELYYGYTRNMAVRKSILDEIGPFVERERGSDVIFVRRCVDRYSCDLVRYLPGVQVTHAEINTLTKFFRKFSIYGASVQGYKHIVPARPLTNGERLEVFRRTVKNHGYSWMQSVSLFGLLGICFFYWVLGSLSSLWNFEDASGDDALKP